MRGTGTVKVVEDDTGVKERKRTVVEIDDVSHISAAPIHHPVVSVEGQLEPKEVQKSRLSCKTQEEGG